MKLHGFDAEDGLFYHLANTYRQIFCSLVAHLIAGLIFVEGLVWFDVFMKEVKLYLAFLDLWNEFYNRLI